jgi:t-SNARE complex subunit (syntaxin)
MTYSRNYIFLREIEEIDNGITAARQFTNLHSIYRKHLHDPFDQHTPQDIQSAGDTSWSTLKSLKDRVAGLDVSDTRYQPQIDRLNKNLTTAFQEYNQIAAHYGRQEDQQILKQEEIHDAIDWGVTDASQVSTLAVDLQSSNALQFETNRNKDIQKAVKGYVEVGALWNQLEEAVIQQGPAMVKVEQKSEETVGDLGRGTHEIKKAEKGARARLSRKWWCLRIISKSFTPHSECKLTSLKF